MTEPAKRYRVKGAWCDDTLWTWAPTDMVLASDFDALLAERDFLHAHNAQLENELAAMREIAANGLAIQKVRDALGPLSLWTKSGFEAEVKRRISAALALGSETERADRT